jgi:glycosyltransferase involved in cell wall biosynthesis
MDLPLVSVVITTFNHVSFIAECLESVLCQKTTFPFEILIGEDDSTDGTREIVRRYEGLHIGKIRVFYRNEKDKLVINGRLTGRFNFIETLKAAKGKYIATLDGDDYWISNDKLQRQVDVLEANEEISICHHGVQHVDAGGNLLDKEYFPGKQLATIKDAAGGRVAVLHSTRIFRASRLSIPDWLYETPVGDIPLTLITSDHGKIFCINEKLSAYRIHSDGLHQGKTEIDKLRSRCETWGVVQNNLSFFDNDIRTEVTKILFFTHFGMAKYFYGQKNFQEGWRHQQFVIFNANLSPKRWMYAAKLSVDYLLGVGRGKE